MSLSGRAVSEIVEAITAAQIELVRGLFRQYQAELALQYRSRSLDSELSALPAEYAPPQGKLLLALVSGQPVGCAGLRPFAQQATCEMKRLYVRPGFRGGKLGIELVDRVLHDARALGYRRLRLDTHPPTMQAAAQMYRKLGFQEVTPADPIDGLVYMELRL
jgi:putative acetyltransferase